MSLRIPKRAGDNQDGEWISREKTLHFTFEGKSYTAFEGDTISSALWAAGQKILGRSFKYHRPRGIFSLANHDVNALMTDGHDTNIRSDIVEVEDGVALHAVNTRGGVKKDKSRYIDAISPLLPVGFYYKAFHTPRRFFPFWERIIRKAAGLGEVNFNYPRLLKRKRHAHCDVLVVGAGAAGMSAASMLAQAGLQVILVDENKRLGGSLTYDFGGNDNSPQAYLADLQRQLLNQPNVHLMPSAYAAGYYADHLIPMVSVDGITKVRAKAVIIATGAFEQPPIFRNNDLPGIMLGSAAQRLIYRYSVKPFNHGIVFTANDYGYRVALDLLVAGSNVIALVDLRNNESNRRCAAELHRQGVKIYAGYCIYEAIASADKSQVSAAIICPYDGQKNAAIVENKLKLSCDGIAMSAGWAPAGALLYQAGTQMRFDEAVQQFVPARLSKGIFAAGKVNGVFDLEQRLNDGRRAASEILRYLELEAVDSTAEKHIGDSPSHSYPIVPHLKAKNFVDYDEDIQLKDFENAAQEGFDNIELMKRFTTVGMGPSQGKHSNMNAIRILAKIRGLPVEKIGTTTARPFFHPVPLGHLAGRSFHPYRSTSLYSWHAGHGAVFTDIGAWKRAAYYPAPGQTKEATVQAEAMAVRKTAGMIDASTFGKVEIYGPEAALFLERFFAGSYADQQVGICRYALLLDEAAVVVDDGLVSRLAEDFFYLTIGTANAAAVYREMQRWLQVWQLNLTLVNVTGAWGALTIAGPAAREILSGLSDCNFAESAFPANAMRETVIAGFSVRILRTAFVSAHGYELHAPMSLIPQLWQALYQHGAPYGLCPFGTDAQRLLRLEMGHALPGIDTDGLTNPYEISAGWAIKMDKPYFIGQRSLQIIAKKPLRKVLVAFALNVAAYTQLPQDGNLVVAGRDIQGRVTSIGYSPFLKKHIGLAYVSPANQAVGSQFHIRTDNGSLVMATVAKTPFLTAENIAADNKMRSDVADDLFRLAPDKRVAPTVAANMRPQAKEVIGVTDISGFARYGLKGAQAAQWLAARGVSVPVQSNAWNWVDETTLILRLGNSEFLIEDQAGGTLCQKLARCNTANETGVYRVPRADISFMLGGRQALNLLSELCALDLTEKARPIEAVLMTQVAGISATLIRQVVAGETVYRLWCDGTYGAYLWGVLCEISDEFGGCATRGLPSNLIDANLVNSDLTLGENR